MTIDDDARDEKRYYIVSPDLRRNPSDFTFINESRALIGGRLAGVHEHSAPGFGMPFRVGVPPLSEKPKLRVGVDATKLDMYGLSLCFVSNRAKILLEGIDREAFEFAECETYDRDGSLIEPYWMAAVVRVVDDFDERRSNVVRYVDRFPESGASPDYPLITQLNDIRMAVGFPVDYHAFYLVQYRDYFLFDDELKHAWSEAGLLGVRFSPVQLPTEEEFRDHLSFVNYPYWTQEARHL